MCETCLTYFNERGVTLAREVRKIATERHLSADDLARRYARAIHTRHLAGQSLEVA